MKQHETTIFVFVFGCAVIRRSMLSSLPSGMCESWPGPEASCHGSVIGDSKPMLAEKGGMTRGVWLKWNIYLRYTIGISLISKHGYISPSDDGSTFFRDTPFSIVLVLQDS